MTNESKDKPLVFENPPIIEVVCGVAFESLKSLLAPHLGLLWQRYHKEFPTCAEAVPLAVQIESRDSSSVETEFFDVPPLARVQLVNNSGDGMIQVQRDKFHYNWQKKEDTEYPRFKNVFALFLAKLETFKSFVSDLELGELKARQYELTYVDRIHAGEGWDTPEDIGKIFPDLVWRNDHKRMKPESLSWRGTFWLPNDTGRLHVSIRMARREEDNQRAFLLDFTARGMLGGSDMNEMEEWFSRAHGDICSSFNELTSEWIQKELWRRVR